MPLPQENKTDWKLIGLIIFMFSPLSPLMLCYLTAQNGWSGHVDAFMLVLTGLSLLWTGICIASIYFFWPAWMITYLGGIVLGCIAAYCYGKVS